ncbi:MAG: hypothetical protein C0518_14360 [Opitutus sp.]|nr:hypothetical protein [Opitutus sp.]
MVEGVDYAATLADRGARHSSLLDEHAPYLGRITPADLARRAKDDELLTTGETASALNRDWQIRKLNLLN